MIGRNAIIRTKCDALSVPSSCWQYVDNHVTVIYTSKGWMPLPLLMCTHSNCGGRLTTDRPVLGPSASSHTSKHSPVTVPD